MKNISASDDLSNLRKNLITIPCLKIMISNIAAIINAIKLVFHFVVHILSFTKTKHFL